jgi:hypothetical protein
MHRHLSECHPNWEERTTPTDLLALHSRLAISLEEELALKVPKVRIGFNGNLESIEVDISSNGSGSSSQGGGKRPAISPPSSLQKSRQARTTM